MIIIKSAREINLMMEAGQVVIKCFERMKNFIHPGISTLDINDECERIIRQEGGIPSSLNYEGFPFAVCVSVNDELVHGFASSKKILRNGDIVSVDIVVKKNGYQADAARTYPVGEVKENAKRLIEATKNAFFEGLKYVKVGNHIGDISHAIETYVKSMGYDVAHEFTGHGIGTSMHEDPYIPNFGEKGEGHMIKEGMTIAIEPMVTEGKRFLKVDRNGWTARTRDGKLSCHYENTVAVTNNGVKILTMPEGENN